MGYNPQESLGWLAMIPKPPGNSSWLDLVLFGELDRRGAPKREFFWEVLHVFYFLIVSIQYISFMVKYICKIL